MFDDTRTLLGAAKKLQNGTSILRDSYPLLEALCSSSGQLAVGEHELSSQHRLLDHAIRALEILDIFESSSQDLFPGSQKCATSAHTIISILDHGWRSAIRQTLLFMDISKGGEKEIRQQWEERGIDLSIHNYASAELLRDSGLSKEALKLIRWHGTMGQFARGEVPLVSYLEIPHEDTNFLHAFFIVNLCDTAAVKEGLLDDTLWGFFEDSFALLHSNSKPTYVSKHSTTEGQERALRFSKLRRGREDAVYAEQKYEEMLSDLSPPLREGFEKRFDLSNFWYCESALAALSIGTQLKIIAFAIKDFDVKKAFHIRFYNLSMSLNPQSAQGRYKLRLLEAGFSNLTLENILSSDHVENILVGVELEVDKKRAIELNLKANMEANALVTLLTIYERKSSAKFHHILKLLCDLYGLRKDTFDRLSNERDYLDHMNSARDDKARMLDYVQGARIIEIGPGGGVVLDLLSQRFPDSNIIGVDLSSEVVKNLAQRKKQENASWDIVYGNAFFLEDLVSEGYDSVIFCSLLHEIFSYVEDEKGKRFQLDSVRHILQAAYRGLNPGGRIVIRDGISPSQGTRIIRFLDPDGPEFLRLFSAQFEGFEVKVEWLDSISAKLSTKAAMEFLYCYTWGPSSFPYEVREQYGVLEYADYVAAIMECLEKEDVKAGTKVKIIDLPKSKQSYLQPGYQKALAPKVIYLDEDMIPVPLPDSNCLMVFEKSTQN